MRPAGPCGSDSFKKQEGEEHEGHEEHEGAPWAWRAPSDGLRHEIPLPFFMYFMLFTSFLFPASSNFGERESLLAAGMSSACDHDVDDRSHER